MADDPPDYLTCPLTLALLVDPVICSDGYTYERKSIEEWLEKKPVSPITDKPIVSIYPNINVRKAVDEWTQQQRSKSNKAESDSEGKGASEIIRAGDCDGYCSIRSEQ